MKFATASREEIAQRFEYAGKRYAQLGVDVEAALKTLAATPISLHCWQGDDVHGFEVHDGPVAGGGIMSTGNYPGCAANADMLRSDAEMALSLIPGAKRFNLHAIYAETDGHAVDRDQLQPEHFAKWMEWAKRLGLALDFNPTYFGHPLANSGYTLSSADNDVRKFWIRHGIASRRIAEAMGKAQNGPCFVNHWIADGAKDQPADRLAPRRRLVESYDEIFAADVNSEYCRDAVESKLFGIGSEDYVVGSHEFYMGYVMNRKNVMLTFDMGHFHPTETIHDKISAISLFRRELLVHISRGIRWDSDHVVIFNDDLRNLFQELVRTGMLPHTAVALDFFDGSINRIGAWVVGTRAAQRAMLYALLEPTQLLRDFDSNGDGAMKLALLEELKTMPWEAVYDEFCARNQCVVGAAVINNLIDIDRNVIRKR